MTHLAIAALIYSVSMASAGLTALILRTIEIARKIRADDRRKRSHHYV